MPLTTNIIIRYTWTVLNDHHICKLSMLCGDPPQIIENKLYPALSQQLMLPGVSYSPIDTRF